MAEWSKNMSLKLPSDSDQFDIADFNANFKDIDNLKVGGRNLLLNSATYIKSAVNNIANYNIGDVVPDAGKKYRLTLKLHLGTARTSLDVYNNTVLLGKIIPTDIVNGIASIVVEWKSSTSNIVKLYQSPSSLSSLSTIEWIKLEEIQENHINASVKLVDNTDYSSASPTNPVTIKEYNSDNLLAYPYKNTSKIMNGITFTDNNDGSITVNGTATANAGFDIQFNCPKSENIILSGCPKGGSSSTYCLLTSYRSSNGTWIYDNYDVGNGLNICDGTKMEYSYINISILIRSGTVCNNLVFKPLLTKGNPIILNRSGKNFVYYLEKQWNGYAFAINDLFASLPIDTNLKIYYNFSTSGINPTPSTGNIILYLESNLVLSNGSIFSISKEQQDKLKLGNGYIYGDSLADSTNSITQVLITLANETNLDYVPYQGNTYSLAVETTCYGNDVVSTDGAVIHNMEFKTFDGTETWLRSDNVFYINSAVSDVDTTKALICNRYKYDGISDGTYDMDNNTFKIYPDSSRIQIKDERFDDAIAFKTWLTSNNVTICYYKSTPTIGTTTPTVITALEGTNTLSSSDGNVVANAEEFEYSNDYNNGITTIQSRAEYPQVFEYSQAPEDLQSSITNYDEISDSSSQYTQKNRVLQTIGNTLIFRCSLEVSASTATASGISITLPPNVFGTDYSISIIPNIVAVAYYQDKTDSSFTLKASAISGTNTAGTYDIVVTSNK